MKKLLIIPSLFLFFIVMISSTISLVLFKGVSFSGGSGSVETVEYDKDNIVFKVDYLTHLPFKMEDIKKVNKSSFYGYRTEGIAGFHSGVDIGTFNANLDLLAMGDGVVIRTYTECDQYGLGFGCGANVNTYCGNFVEYKITGKKLYILYCHMKDVFVKKGDSIVSGQLLGTNGNSGASQGKHLHLQFNSISYLGDKEEYTYNPYNFFDFK